MGISKSRKSYKVYFPLSSYIYKKKKEEREKKRKRKKKKKREVENKVKLRKVHTKELRVLG